VRPLALLVVLISALAVAGCGGGSTTTVTVTKTEQPTISTDTGSTTTAPATTDTTGTTTGAGTTSIQLFFLRDDKVGATRREIPATVAVGSAALKALADGPTAYERGAGLTSEVPHDGNFSLQLMQGTAVVTGPHVGDAASAQIVYTLTQFPTVKTVRINGGNAGARSDWERLTPAILVLDPVPGQTVASPVRISGTANTFEATLQLELRDADDKVLARRFTTATSGSGTRGTFDTTLSVPAGHGGDVTLVAYENSAANGDRINVVRVPLKLAG
jgi:immunoglobulin-like protein involved in spore germination/sporulation and spore germination protein